MVVISGVHSRRVVCSELKWSFTLSAERNGTVGTRSEMRVV